MDTISTETSRLQSLKESHQIEVDQENKKKESNSVAAAAATAATEEYRIGRLNEEKKTFEAECRNEAEEKKSLLQAVINEAEDSGYPMPPSLIKLLNNTNGKRHKFLFIEFIYNQSQFRGKTIIEHSTRTANICK